MLLIGVGVRILINRCLLIDVLCQLGYLFEIPSILRSCENQDDILSLLNGGCVFIVMFSLLPLVLSARQAQGASADAAARPLALSFIFILIANNLYILLL